MFSRPVLFTAKGSTIPRETAASRSLVLLYPGTGTKPDRGRPGLTACGMRVGATHNQGGPLVPSSLRTLSHTRWGKTLGSLHGVSPHTHLSTYTLLLVPILWATLKRSKEAELWVRVRSTCVISRHAIDLDVYGRRVPPWTWRLKYTHIRRL